MTLKTLWRRHVEWRLVTTDKARRFCERNETMRKQALFAAVLAFAFAGDAEAARRWFVDDAAGVIVTMTDDDNAPTPAGTTAVLDATIRMVNPPGPDGDMLPATDVRVDVGDAAQGFNNATNVEDAPGSDKLIGRGWIRDIP